MYEGIHWNCGRYLEALKVNWIVYDRVSRSEIPRLNVKFKRSILTDENDFLNYDERRHYLRLMFIYMCPVSEGIVSFSSIKTEEIITLCRITGHFSSAKRIDEGKVLVMKCS